MIAAGATNAWITANAGSTAAGGAAHVGSSSTSIARVGGTARRGRPGRAGRCAGTSHGFDGALPHRQGRGFNRARGATWL
jgi:hypothetical protein